MTEISGTDAAHRMLDALERAMVVEGSQLESDPVFRGIVDDLDCRPNQEGGMPMIGLSLQMASAIIASLQFDIMTVGITSSAKKRPDDAVAEAIARVRDSLEQHRRTS